MIGPKSNQLAPIHQVYLKGPMRIRALSFFLASTFQAHMELVNVDTVKGLFNRLSLNAYWIV